MENMGEYASMLASYGALGVVSIYFMWKDCSVSKELTQAIKEWTAALEVLVHRGE